MLAWITTALRRRRRRRALAYLETLPPWLREDIGIEVAEIRKLRRGLCPHPPRAERPLDPATFCLRAAR